MTTFDNNEDEHREDDNNAATQPWRTTTTTTTTTTTITMSCCPDWQARTRGAPAEEAIARRTACPAQGATRAACVTEHPAAGVASVSRRSSVVR